MFISVTQCCRGMTLTSVPFFLVHNGICGSYQCAPGDSEWGTLVWWLEATGDEYAQFLHSCRCLSMCRCRPPLFFFSFFVCYCRSTEREQPCKSHTPGRKCRKLLLRVHHDFSNNFNWRFCNLQLSCSCFCLCRKIFLSRRHLVAHFASFALLVSPILVAKRW